MFKKIKETMYKGSMRMASLKIEIINKQMINIGSNRKEGLDGRCQGGRYKAQGFSSLSYNGEKDPH